MVTIEQKTDAYKIVLDAGENISVTVNGGTPIVWTVPVSNTAQVHYKYIQIHD